VTELTGSNGFRLEGTGNGNLAGYSVAHAGDVNDDGLEDFVIGEPFAGDNPLFAGASYVVYGSTAAQPSVLKLSTVDGSNGFRISGAAESDASGIAVSSGGDINGDGIDDFIIGASGADPNGASSGAAYVIFGKQGGFGSKIDLSELDGANGFRLAGEAASDRAGSAVSSAGDVNSDGYSDIVIGASRASPHGAESGASYVVFGAAGGFPSSIELSSLNGTTGFKLNGARAYDRTGLSVSSAGDFNNDGFDDFIIGAPYVHETNQKPGRAYIVYGKGSAFSSSMELSALNGTQGIKLVAGQEGDYLGVSVSGIGDFNGDGFNDVAIGAPDGTGVGYDRYLQGLAYVVFGGASMPATVQLLELDGQSGMVVQGKQSNDLGQSVAAAGDIDGDGFSDVVIGDPAHWENFQGNSYDIGAAHVLFGRNAGLGFLVDVAAFNGRNGFSVVGKKSDFYNCCYTGLSVSGGGDFNGDGTGDLIVGSPKEQPPGENNRNGGGYIVYGGAKLRVPGLAVASDPILDGHAIESGENSGKGGAINTSATYFRVGDTAKDQQIRGFISFDTSEIPDNATITSAQLHFKVNSWRGEPFNKHGKLIVDMKSGGFAGNASLVPKDFQATATIPQTLSLSRQTILSYVGWHIGAFSASESAMINKTGLTQFRLRWSKDDDDDGKADYYKFVSGSGPYMEQPLLVVTYTEP
jgi:hypothetical protein